MKPSVNTTEEDWLVKATRAALQKAAEEAKAHKATLKSE
jgi:hypothetical protein